MDTPDKTQDTPKPTSSYQSFLGSPIVKIIAGASKTLFNVHSCLLSSKSCYFTNMLIPNGRWEGSRTYTINWKEFDEKVVAGFVEFLYRGTYSCPGEEEEEEEEEEEDNAGGAGEVEEDAGAGGSVRPLTPVAEMLPPCSRSREISRPTVTFPVLMFHARLYVLGCHTQIPRLCTLSLRHFILGLEAVESIEMVNLVALVKYVFANTAEKAARKEPLRKALTAFIAHNIEIMYACAEFTELLEGGGELAADLMVAVVRKFRGAKVTVEKERDMINKKLETSERTVQIYQKKYDDLHEKYVEELRRRFEVL